MATKRQSKVSKAVQLLAEMAKEQGAELDLASIEKLRDSPINTNGQSNREAESVLRSLHKPHAYMMKKCKRKDCGAVFQTNYCATAYCSDYCLAADLRELGIAYDPYEKRRWESSMYSGNSGIIYRYEPPEYISTETISMLEIYAKQLLDDLYRLKALSVDQEKQQTQKTHQEHGPFGDFFEDVLDEKDQEKSEPLPMFPWELDDVPPASDSEEHHMPTLPSDLF